MILGLTGSFGNLDASGRFRQGTLLGMARGGKADGGGGASGGGGGGGGRGGGGATAAGLRKKQITDAAGAWTGICFCGAKAKVCVGVERRRRLASTCSWSPCPHLPLLCNPRWR